MLALRTFLIPSISKDLLWKEVETITHIKYGTNMGVHRLARALDDMQSKLIDKQGRKSITDEVKIREFLYNLADIIKKPIAPHQTDDRTYHDIVTKSEQFEAANRGSNAECTKPWYTSQVSRYTHATGTQSSYPTLQPRRDKSQPSQNRLATPGARSTASAGTNTQTGIQSRKPYLR